MTRIPRGPSTGNYRTTAVALNFELPLAVAVALAVRLERLWFHWQSVLKVEA
jgi:hypothetical protein